MMFYLVRALGCRGLGWTRRGLGSGSAPRWLPAGIRLRRWHQHGLLHCRIAEALGLPVPGSGESVSARLAAARPHHGEAPRIELDGQEWVLARPDDPMEAVPKLPEI
ncbi:NaeI family type II restriction endonuclease [Streptomyces sp. NPDC102264]|uniref:NaeI family type II restriction endonuclease n=1 Tax=Streptomyces sp. NPDC102264 TaxID=3366149 RepID=UPI003814A170